MRVEPRVSVGFCGNHSVITLERSVRGREYLQSDYQGSRAGTRGATRDLESECTSSRADHEWHAKCLLEIVLPLGQTTNICLMNMIH